MIMEFLWNSLTWDATQRAFQWWLDYEISGGVMIVIAHERIKLEHRPLWAKDGNNVYYGETDMEQGPIAVTPEGVELLCYLSAYRFEEDGGPWEIMGRALHSEASRRKQASEAVKEPPQDEWPGVFATVASHLHHLLQEADPIGSRSMGAKQYPDCLALVAQTGYDMHQRIIPVKSLRLVMQQWNWRESMGLSLPSGEELGRMVDDA